MRNEMESRAALNAAEAENARLREAHKTVRAFIQDCMDNCLDHRSIIGNLMAARDAIDAALSQSAPTR